MLQLVSYGIALTYKTLNVSAPDHKCGPMVVQHFEADKNGKPLTLTILYYIVHFRLEKDAFSLLIIFF